MFGYMQSQVDNWETDVVKEIAEYRRKNKIK